MKVDLEPIRQRNPRFKFSQKVRNNRLYVTVSPKDKDSVDYLELLQLLRNEFEDVRITSGSGFAMCGVLPTVFELMEHDFGRRD